MLFTKTLLYSNFFQNSCLIFSAAFFLITVNKSLTAHAASENALSIQNVELQILITKISDLDFGVTSQGAALKIVSANTIETPENASFLVLGQPNTAFTISLPASSVFLNHATSSDQIEIDQFNSQPTVSGNLSPTGQRLLFVGARRSAIAPALSTGLYTGSFSVSVVY